METSTAPAEPELVDAVISSELTVADLWRRYFKLGGRRTRDELRSYLALGMRWNVREHGILKRALVI